MGMRASPSSAGSRKTVSDKIHLPGQALHLAVAERRPVFEHRQLVALQARASKYIDDHVRH